MKTEGDFGLISREELSARVDMEGEISTLLFEIENQVSRVCWKEDICWEWKSRSLFFKEGDISMKFFHKMAYKKANYR